MASTIADGFHATRPAAVRRDHGVLPARVADESSGPQRFVFTGTGSEYFRIWVVNLLLTILTFGVYSAWAKVRRLQYFYRNTHIAGAVFDYHGNPKAILKGRMLALSLVMAYKIAADLSFMAMVAVLLSLACILPWLLARAFHFKLYNSSYRGLRFHFKGTAGQAYRSLNLFPILFGLTGFFIWSLVTSFAQKPGFWMLLVVLLPLLLVASTVPLAHYLLKRYQHDNAYFGQAPFFFDGRLRDFFTTYAKAVAFFILASLGGAVFGFITRKLYTMLQEGMFGWLFGMLYGVISLYVFYLFVRPYLESRLQNMIWNTTELGDHRFESSVTARKLLWLHASNLALIVLTLGLYKPFAAIRLIKYKTEQMVLLPSGKLEEFCADQSGDAAGAIGQEAGDLFDIDIAL